MKNLIWYLVAGTKGGETRGKIINLVDKKPSNANKIALDLKLDYKTVRHHLEVLQNNRIVYSINKGSYGAVFFLSEEMKANMAVFGEIWEQFGYKSGKSK